ncbi:MAG: hypothetical protein JOZ14_03210, partial [Acidobacteria bacterium]|nr:hypothetical protein [Acidobacteriota bacterium]
MEYGQVNPASEPPTTIREGIDLLTRRYPAGSIIELRVLDYPNPNGRAQRVSGFYDDPAKLAADAAECNQLANVYVTLNPVRRSWQLADNGAYNIDAAPEQNQSIRTSRQKGQPEYECSALRTTADEDILRRQWVLVDIDAGQPPGTSSTDAEKKDALLLGDEVLNYLIDRGFPEPSLCDSGNGGHALIPVDLDNSPENTDLVKRFLSV